MGKKSLAAPVRNSYMVFGHEKRERERERKTKKKKKHW